MVEPSLHELAKPLSLFVGVGIIASLFSIATFQPWYVTALVYIYTCYSAASLTALLLFEARKTYKDLLKRLESGGQFPVAPDPSLAVVSGVFPLLTPFLLAYALGSLDVVAKFYAEEKSLYKPLIPKFTGSELVMAALGFALPLLVLKFVLALNSVRANLLGQA
ncbi:MAG TPA: hypothetical protein EYP08_03445 [Pyrodictiaceae archaeon]|nr:hypothetical protein [Pyrodictiaceae archaeon]HIQ55101.1 hypothetical protein [Pyrodictium sp.]